VVGSTDRRPKRGRARQAKERAQPYLQVLRPGANPEIAVAAEGGKPGSNPDCWLVEAGQQSGAMGTPGKGDIMGTEFRLLVFVFMAGVSGMAWASEETLAMADTMVTSAPRFGVQDVIEAIGRRMEKESESL